MTRWMMGCAAMLVAGAASGQIFECIDAKGNREFARACPPGTVKERQVQSGTGASTAGATTPAAKSLAEKDAEFRKRTMDRQETETKSAKEQADAKDVRRNCDEARAQLRGLQEGQRIVRTDPNTGERTFLDDKDRPGEIALAQKTVDSWCNKK